MNNRDTEYKTRQAERQKSLVESKSSVFDGAENRGLVSWKQDGETFERESRKVLKHEDRSKNLYAPLRNEVISYMHDKGIKWWGMVKESDAEVTANMLSSQVHCLNHLFAIRNDADAIKAVLKHATGIEFDEILPSLIDNDSLITFEFVYHNMSLLNERHETRGAKCTSIDALIYAQKGNEKWLIPIEWKYTESYNKDNKVDNYDRYKDMPSQTSHLESWSNLYRTDPYYELGRQSLLMEKVIEKYPKIADKYFHIVVVPKGNTEMRADATIFQNSLKKECRELFAICDPEEFLSPLASDSPDLFEYLKTRYWK